MTAPTTIDGDVMNDTQLIVLLRQAGFNVGVGARPDVWANELATEGEYDALDLFRALLSASKPAAPHGFSIVPTEAVDLLLQVHKEGVLNAADKFQRGCKLLAAAPAAPSADAQDERGARDVAYDDWTKAPDFHQYQKPGFDAGWKARAALNPTDAAAPAQSQSAPAMTNGDFHCPACGTVMKAPTACGSCLWEADTCGYQTAAPQPAQTAPSVVVLDDERAACDAAYAKQSGNRLTNENDFGAGWEYAIEWMHARAASPQATATQPAQTLALIREAVRSLSIRADELKASNTSFDGTWCDAAEEAAYNAEVDLIERLRALLAAQPASGGDNG